MLRLSPRSEHVLAEQPGGAGGVELGADRGLLGAVLVADEHPALLGADREHAGEHPLDHEVRLLGQDLAVLERARLGLVGVADHVLGLGRLGRDDLPLGAGREPGAAHAPQARVLDRLDRVLGGELAGEHRPHDGVAFGGGPRRRTDRSATIAAASWRGPAARRRRGPAARRRERRRPGPGARRRSPPGRCHTARCTRPRGPRSRRRRRSGRGSAAICSSAPCSQHDRSRQTVTSTLGGAAVRKCG